MTLVFGAREPDGSEPPQRPPSRRDPISDWMRRSALAPLFGVAAPLVGFTLAGTDRYGAPEWVVFAQLALLVPFGFLLAISVLNLLLTAFPRRPRGRTPLERLQDWKPPIDTSLDEGDEAVVDPMPDRRWLIAAFGRPAFRRFDQCLAIGLFLAILGVGSLTFLPDRWLALAPFMPAPQDRLAWIVGLSFFAALAGLRRWAIRQRVQLDLLQLRARGRTA